MEVNANPSDPVRLEIDYPESSSRLLALLAIIPLKVILLLPVTIVMSIVSIAVTVCMLIGWFAVLFTGKYPRGMFDFIVRYLKWRAQVGAYYLSMSDKYPPFFPE